MIDIIICTFNNEKIVGNCLDSIKKQTYKKFSCYVVDDNSSDNTVNLVRKKYPWVKIIKKDKNTGPSISRNIGIENSNSEFIVVMDSDVVLEKNWLEKQIKAVNEPNIAIVGCKLLFMDSKKINSAGGSLTKLGFGFDRGRGEQKNNYNKIEKVIYVCSAACIIRRDVLKKIGLFDETYFYPHEDTDIGWRANIAGYDVIYNPDAMAYHMQGETVKTMGSLVVFNATKNRIRSMIKNYETWNIVKYLPVHKIIILTDIAVRRNRTAKIRALWWNMINLKDTLKERRAVNKIRKAKDCSIKKLFDNRLIGVMP